MSGASRSASGRTMSDKRSITTILGKAGSGKTHLTREILLAYEPPILVIDTMNEFHIGLQFERASHLRDYIVSGRRNVSGIYVLNSQTDEDSRLFFRLLASSRAACTAVVDEASLFCNPNYIDENLNASIQYGRHWRQNLIFNARRPAEINRNLTAQSDCIVSFRQTEARDVATLRQSFAEAERLPELEEHQFMAFGDVDKMPYYDVLLKMKTPAGLDAFANPVTPP